LNAPGHRMRSSIPHKLMFMSSAVCGSGRASARRRSLAPGYSDQAGRFQKRGCSVATSGIPAGDRCGQRITFRVRCDSSSRCKRGALRQEKGAGPSSLMLIARFGWDQNPIERRSTRGRSVRAVAFGSNVAGAPPGVGTSKPFAIFLRRYFELPAGAKPRSWLDLCKRWPLEKGPARPGGRPCWGPGERNTFEIDVPGAGVPFAHPRR